MTYGIRRLMCIQGEQMSRSASEAAAASAAAMGEDGDFPDVHSPTDSSEDSVEVRVRAISFSPSAAAAAATARGKRKRTEPRRLPDAALLAAAPLKKRMCLQARVDQEAVRAAQARPFRPWSPPPSSPEVVPPPLPLPPPPPCRGYGAYFRPPSPMPAHIHEDEDVEDVQPVALVKKSVVVTAPTESTPPSPTPPPPRVPVHPHAATLSTVETDRLLLGAAECFPALRRQPHDAASSTTRREQRNYKNMTRERRIEANARERTRVHTISAAFDTLRRSVPAYSHNQKLSKLSVLRIACSYIKTLAGIAGRRDDGHTDADADAALADSVDAVSRTIQREGKLRKKKDDND